MAETRYRRNFSLDREIYFEIRDLAKKYDINLSRLVDDAFLQVLLVLREIDKMVQDNPDGVPRYAARSYLEDLMKRQNSTNNALIQEFFPEKSPKKTKA